MTENLNYLLSLYHFLDISVCSSYRPLLVLEIFSAFSADILYNQQYNAKKHGNKHEQTPCNIFKHGIAS